MGATPNPESQLHTDNTAVSVAPAAPGCCAFARIYLFRVVQLALVANCEHAPNIKVGDEPVQSDVTALAE
jgi:hypothetical protein